MSFSRPSVMLAEWSPHQATWLSWPHNNETWPGLLPQAEQAYVEIVCALAPHEHVHINVQSQDHADHIAALLDARAPAESISFETIETDDAWIRDYGAVIVRASDSVDQWLALDFDYNAWGGKYPPFDRDRAVAGQMADRLGLQRFSDRMVFEGGSIDVNGAGLGLTTEQCLLNPNRNPDLDRDEIENRLARLLGIDQLIWLGAGISGDDTDGHIDNLARFVGPDRVVAVVEADKAGPDHAALADNLDRLRNFRRSDGQALEVVELPLPPPVVHRGDRLPASFANFYIANGVVLVPAFGGSADARAQGILADCFPGRTIVPVDCRALIVGLGALHCLTQQIPVIVGSSGQ